MTRWTTLLPTAVVAGAWVSLLLVRVVLVVARVTLR